MNKKFILTLIALIIALVVVVILIRLTWQSLKEVKAEVSRKEIELTAINALVAQTEQIKKEQKEFERESVKISLVLPEKNDIPNLLVQFETIALANGLILESINFSQTDEENQKQSGAIQWDSAGGPPKTKGPFQSSEIELALSGTYSAFKNFLKALENNIRASNVESISFGAGKLLGESGLDFFEFKLKAEVYYQ